MSYPLTAVSGYWIVKNKHDTKYLKWFERTLKINCPYIFFGNEYTIEIAKIYRGSLPTHYIECEIEDFHTYKYKDRIVTHPIHCPSVELNLIWNEKVFFMEKALRLNLYNSEFFMWVDAGICTYRNIDPPTRQFPDLNKLDLLPKDKFIFTSTESSIYESSRLNTYYHHVAGTSYIMNKSIIEKVCELYDIYLEKLIQRGTIFIDQVVLTHIFNDYPELFKCIGHGYGEIVQLLY